MTRLQRITLWLAATTAVVEVAHLIWQVQS
jgi:hypothetical protein